MYKTLYSEKYKKLRMWLKDHRESRGLSMRDLGKILQVTHSFIGKIENGERRLDIIEYIQYCEALQISPKDGLKVISQS